MFRRLTEMLGDLLDVDAENDDSRRHDRRRRHDDGRWYEDETDDVEPSHGRRRRRFDEGFDID